MISGNAKKKQRTSYFEGLTQFENSVLPVILKRGVRSTIALFRMVLHSRIIVCIYIYKFTYGVLQSKHDYLQKE